MKFKKYKEGGIEVPLPVMNNDDMAEFWYWCVENDIDVKIKHKKGIAIFRNDSAKKATFFSVEDMQKNGWNDIFSKSEKEMIKNIIPEKLKNYGKYAVVENEEDAIAVILRWT